MNKKLKSIEVGLIGCGDAVTLNASDTATEPIASYALESFKAEKYMDFERNGTEYLVPFHAVDYIIITEATESVEDKPNPYGCEPSGGGTDTYTINFVPNPSYSTCDRETVIVQKNVKIGDTIEYPSCECESPTFMGGWAIHDIAYIITPSDKPTLDQELASYAVNGVITLDQSCER